MDEQALSGTAAESHIPGIFYLFHKAGVSNPGKFGLRAERNLDFTKQVCVFTFKHPAPRK